MTNKIKLFMGFLGLVALFSVFNFFNSFGNSSSTFLKPLTGSVLEAVDQDDDKDGLANREESYWNTDFQNPDTDGDGFLDGEEVASGHDPLKPGPDDILGPPNLTDKVQTLVVGGLYSKDLKPDNQQFEASINDLSAVIVDDFYKSLPLQNHQIILTDNSKENQETYLKNAGQVMKQALIGPHTTNIGLGQSADQYIVFLVESKNNFKNAYERLSQLPVPKDWQEIHHALLEIINKSILDYGYIGSYQTDPYRAYIALNDIQNMDSDVKNLLKQVNSNINKNHLVLDNNFYKLLNQLYK